MDGTELFDAMVGRIVQRLNFNGRNDVIAIAKLLFPDEGDTKRLEEVILLENGDQPEETPVQLVQEANDLCHVVHSNLTTAIGLAASGKHYGDEWEKAQTAQQELLRKLNNLLPPALRIRNPEPLK